MEHSKNSPGSVVENLTIIDLNKSDFLKDSNTTLIQTNSESMKKIKIIIIVMKLI